MTKHEMAYQMDKANYRHLPWLHMYDAFTKAEMIDEYQKFLNWKNNK